MEDNIPDCITTSRDTILNVSGELVLIKNKLKYFKDSLMQSDDENYKTLRTELAIDIIYAIKYVDRCLNTVLKSKEIA